MGNTVGSTNVDFWNLKIDKNLAYIIGLWCADGYHRTSSIGLSNTDIDLIHKFSKFLSNHFPKERLKLRIYEPDSYKRRTRAYHTYVNSRPLLRAFKEAKQNTLKFINEEFAFAYIAGRFDGDGSIGKDFYRDCRIIYGNEYEAKSDKELLEKVGFEMIKIYHYKSAHTFCLYVSRFETVKFLTSIYTYSIRLQKSTFVPRRDLITAKLQ